MIAINQFTGIMPKLDATKLPDNAATVAVDCDFTGGRIAGIPLSHDTGPSYPAAASAYAYTDSSEITHWYTLPYDADFVRSPVQQDDHRRVYWTGKNGAATEFRFMLVGDNLVDGTPSVSYRVGVAPFVVANVKMNNAIDIHGAVVPSFSAEDQNASIGGYQLVPVDPPIAWGELSNVKNSIHLVDEYGVSLRDITGDLTDSHPVGQSYRGWFSQYEFTLSKKLTDYTQTTTPEAKYSLKSERIRILSTTCDADIWYEVTQSSDGSPIYTLRYVELLGGVVLYENVGKNVTIFLESNGAYLGRMAVLSPSTLSYDGSAFPESLSTSPSVSAADSSSLSNARMAFFCTATFNGVTSTAKFIQNETLTNAWSEGSGISGGVTSGSTDYKWLLNLRFGEDLGSESRAYLFTFVNRLGEESAPFGVTEMTVNAGSERVKFFINEARMNSHFASMQAERYPLHGIRVYRTSSGTGANAMFFYVGTVTTKNESVTLPGEVYIDRFNLEGPSYVFYDGRKSAELGAACTTIDLISDVNELQKLQGLVTLYNGILAAFKDNEVWYCEPYQPWAWKRANVHTLPYKVVAILPVEQGAYVLTDNSPFYISGQTPDTMVPTKLSGQYPCIDKRAAATINGKSVYLSADGIVLLSGANVTLDTMAFNRETWRKAIGSFVGFSGAVSNGKAWLMAYGHRMLMFFTSPTAGAGGYLVDMDSQSWTRMTTPILNAMVAPPRTGGRWVDGVWAGGTWMDNLLYSTGSGNWMVFGYEQQTALWQWSSKDFVLPRPVNFGVFQLFGTGRVTITFTADGVLRHSKTVTLSENGVVDRLPGGFLAATWRIGITALDSGTELKALYVAKSPMELANV